MPQPPVGRRQEPLPASLPDDPVDRAEIYATGCRSLGIAVLQSALAHDPDWFQRERGALRFWCDLIGLDPDAVQAAFRRRQAGRPV